MTQEQALHKAAALCSRGEKCSYDIRIKLEKWGIEESEIQDILQYLKKEKFIDNQRFATAFANDKMRFNYWGKQKIRYALAQKQISKTEIDEAMSSFTETEYIDMLESELGKKYKELSRKVSEQFKLKNKLIQFGKTRGYEPELWKIVGEM